MVEEVEGRRSEQVMDKPWRPELQKERRGWTEKHALQDEEKMFVDLLEAEQKV